MIGEDYFERRDKEIWLGCVQARTLLAVTLFGALVPHADFTGFVVSRPKPTFAFRGGIQYTGLKLGRVGPTYARHTETIYASAIATGLMIIQFTRWLQKMPVDSDLSVNLLASEFAVAAAA